MRAGHATSSANLPNSVLKSMRTEFAILVAIAMAAVPACKGLKQIGSVPDAAGDISSVDGPNGTSDLGSGTQGGAGSGSTADGSLGGAAGFEADASGGMAADAESSDRYQRTGDGASSDGPAADVAVPEAAIDISRDTTLDASCSVGITRCSTSGPAVEVCTLAGTWMLKESCPSICANGACSGSCMPHAKHCGAAQTPETCSSAGDWVPAIQPCPFVCTGQGICGGDCMPGSGTCMGTVHYTCNQDGKYAPDNGSQCKVQNGDPCRGSSDCMSGNCVGGICCSDSCSGTCLSCASADTGKANGTCSAIQAGHVAPAGQCPVSDPTSCGSNGKCDGSGRCQMWPSTITCDNGGCDTAGRLTPPGKCNGSGACGHDPAVACGNHLVCTSNACPPACTQDQECEAGYYCHANQCIARCRVSIGNLVPNGGFDSTAGWTFDNAHWVSADGLQCTTSGSAHLEDSGSGSEIRSPCFKVSPSTTYTFGASIRGANVSDLFCNVSWYLNITCAAESTHPSDITQANSFTAQWEPVSTTVASASDAEYALVSCTTYSGGKGEVDLIYLKPGTGAEY
jgi:hypothetical protein